jgi:hypothetical protein
MKSSKVLQLIKKYADEPAGTVMFEQSENRFKHQRQRLTEFSHSFHTRMRVLIAEIEYDIGILKDRGFDKDMRMLMTQIWVQLVEIFKAFKQDEPYKSAAKIIQYVRAKSTRSIIDNLEFLAKHHVEKTNVDFGPSKVLVHPEIRGLTLLTSLTDYLEKYIKENPLLSKDPVITPMPPRQDAATWRPPAPNVTPQIIMPPKDLPEQVS